MNADGSVEALDWNCRLRVDQSISKPPAFVGIRAHHLDFLESVPAGAASENVLPCWLVRASETPFRITLYLSLRRQPVAETSSYRFASRSIQGKVAALRQSPAPVACAAFAGLTIPYAGMNPAGNLIEVFYKLHVQAVRSIHIAKENNRKVALHVVLHLN